MIPVAGPTPTDDSALTEASSGRSSSMLVAAGILASRIAGLVRASVFNAFLGVGASADALGFATRVPNVLQNLLGEGSLSASFIPVYSAELDRDEEEAGRIAGAVAALLALTAAVIVVVSWIFAPQIAALLMIFTGGSEDPRFELTVTLLRIIFPSTGLLVLSAWCLGILNSHRQFFLSYVAPVLWNIAQIVAVVGAVVFFAVGDTTDAAASALASPSGNIDLLGDVAEVAAWGFLIGSAIQFLVQLPYVLRVVRGLRVRLDTSREGVREILRRFVGAVSGRGVVQISAFADTILAGALTAGAVGALVNAQILHVLPISLFALSVAAAELPEMSRMKDPSEVRERTDRGFGQIAFFVGFTAIAYVLLGDKIVGALFERGEFNSDDTLLVWFVLGTYAFGLIPSALSRLTQNAIWSQGDTNGPARIAFVRVVLAIVLSVLAMPFFDRIGVADVRGAFPTLFDVETIDDQLRFGAMGITLASAIAAWVEAGLLQRLADRTISGINPLKAVGPLAPALVASSVVAVVMRVVTDDVWPPLALVLAVGLSGLTYVGVCWVKRVPAVNALLIGPLARFRR